MQVFLTIGRLKLFTGKQILSGAVHCFQDEHGNWQTYTFGGHSQTSSHLSPVDTSGKKGNIL